MLNKGQMYDLGQNKKPVLNTGFKDKKVNSILCSTHVL
jgi:hypothetical protein